MTDAGAPRERRLLRAFVAVSVLLVAAVFGPHLAGAFVWDDVYLVVDNPLVRDAGGLGRLLTRDLWGGATGAPTQLYHPVPMLTLWAQARLGMGVPWLRAGNVVMHLACGALLYLVARRRLALSRGAAALATALFLVHPSTTEVVMWLTGRHDSVAVVCALGALVVWPRGDDRATSPALRALAGAVLALLAFFSKEPYVVVPALLVLFEARARLAREPSAGPGWLALPFVTVGAGFALRAALGIPSSSAQTAAPLGVHLQTFGSILLHYGAQLASFGNGMTTQAYRPAPMGLALGAVAALAGAVVALAVLAWRGRRYAGLAALGLAWFGLALAPHVVSLPVLGMFGNRYGYFPLMGLLLALAAGAEAAFVRAELARFRPALAAFAMGLVLLLGLATSAEASAWRDAVTLFGADVERDPKDARALYHYAHAVTRARGCAAAIPLYARAVDAEPTYQRAWHNLAGCLVNERRWPQAVTAAGNALALAPDDARAEYNLGVALANAGRLPEATSHLERAVRLRPDYAAAKTALDAVKRAASQ